MHPAGQQQPALPLHHLPRRPTLAEELGTAYLIHRCPSMLHDVEFVVDDLAVRGPLFDALPERFPHIHTCRPNRAPLKLTQVLLQEFVQRLFLPLPTEPQRLPRGQVADYRPCKKSASYSTPMPG